jgi:hypothetical protein
VNHYVHHKEPMNHLITRYQRALQECQKNSFTDNWDHRRFGPPKSDHSVPALRQIVKRLLRGLGLYQKSASPEQTITAHAPELDWLHSHLADQESRDLLIMILAYRTLGHRHVKLPLNTSEYWNGIERMENLCRNSETIDLGFKDWKAYKQDLAQFGYPLIFFSTPNGAYTQLILQQYRCQSGHRIIEAIPGDVVLDCGACYGETALYFAFKAGPNGRVLSFEFMPENLTVFQGNMLLNNQIAHRIKLLEYPLWSIRGGSLHSGQRPWHQSGAPIQEWPGEKNQNTGH